MPDASTMVGTLMVQPPLIDKTYTVGILNLTGFEIDGLRAIYDQKVFKLVTRRFPTREEILSFLEALGVPLSTHKTILNRKPWDTQILPGFELPLSALLSAGLIVDTGKRLEVLD